MKETAHILVVDDESEVCQFLKEFLEIEGYTVLTASSGMEALRYVQEQSLDLVLLDIKMEGMDGLETLRRIRGCDRQLS
ncbi:MAG: response regulator [Candidatus Entotheonellia bacterium]